MIRPCLPIAAVLCFSFLGGCGTKNTSSSPSTGGAPSGGELFPYYGGTEFRFVGSYFGDHVYVRPGQTVHLQNDVLVADTFLVTEQFAHLVRNPSTQKAAIVTDLTAVGALRDSDFVSPPQDSLMEKAIQVHASQQSANGRTRSGQTRKWLYIGLGPDLHAVYISTTDGVQRRDSLELIPMLSIKEQRCQVYIDSQSRRFAPVNTNLLGSPQEKIAYRPIRDGQMEDKIWEIIRDGASP